MFFRKSNKIVEMVSGHSESVVACFNKLSLCMTELFEEWDQQKLELATREIRHLESQADDIRRDIIRQLLLGGLIMESRKSIMHIIEAVDRVADLSEDILQELFIQGIQLPEFTHTPIRKMLTTTSGQLTLLSEVVVGAVSKYKEDQMTQRIMTIERLESEVDDLEQLCIKELYRTDLPLAKKQQYREIIQMIGRISDLIEDISDEIEIVMMARKV